MTDKDRLVDQEARKGAIRLMSVAPVAQEAPEPPPPVPETKIVAAVLPSEALTLADRRWMFDTLLKALGRVPTPEEMQQGFASLCLGQ